MWAGRPTRGACGGSLGPCRPARAGPYVRLMKIRFSKAPTFTKAIIASAVFAIAYLASTSSLPSCSDTVAILSSGGECIERQSFLHTASGWLALICLAAASAARAQAQERHRGAADAGTASAPRAVGTRSGACADARAGFELLRQVRHPHHRGRQLLPRLRSPNGVPEILTEIPSDITDLR